MYVLIGMWMMYLCVKFTRGIVTNPIIHFGRLAWYTLHFLEGGIMCLYLTVIRFIEPVEAKKFVMFRPCRGVEVDSNRSVNNIPETFSSIRFVFETRKLHVWSCVHHVNFFVEMKLVECGDYDVERPGLWSYSVYQYSFSVSWLSSYNFYGGPMG